jgi:hypothetical protein
MLSHLLLEDLLEDGFHALTHPSFDVLFYGLLEVIW